MPDQKLTPEQVAGFEARAAAGERPALEWCHWPTNGTKEISVLAFLHDSAIRIYWPSQRRGRVSDQFYLCFGVHDGENSAFASGDFTTLLAAQLAAEHLLAEATLPIHASALASRDGEIAALRAELERAVTEAERQNRSLRVDVSVMRDYERGDVWLWDSEDDNDVESLSCPVLISAEDIRGLVARAEAAEARARGLEGTVNNQAKDLRTAHESLDEADARVSALEAALWERDKLLNSLHIVLTRARDEAYKWSHHHAVKGAKERVAYWEEESKMYSDAMESIDAARAGGQGT